jgi:hypothetical protein
LKILLAGVLTLATLAAASSSLAQEPVQNISPYRHGNLAHAQQLTVQAFDTLTAAQQANNYDLGGHVGRAKELLREANGEIKLAARFANQR